MAKLISAFHIEDKIKKARIAKGIKQKDMAQMLNIPYSTYSNYENGNRVPDLETVERIAKVLEMDSRELITGKPSEEEIVSFIALAESITFMEDMYDYCLTQHEKGAGTTASVLSTALKVMTEYACTHYPDMHRNIGLQKLTSLLIGRVGESIL